MSNGSAYGRRSGRRLEESSVTYQVSTLVVFLNSPSAKDTLVDHVSRTFVDTCLRFLALKVGPSVHPICCECQTYIQQFDFKCLFKEWTWAISTCSLVSVFCVIGCSNLTRLRGADSLFQRSVGCGKPLESGSFQ